MFSQLRQQAAVLKELHRELEDDNRLMESQLSGLPVKLDNVTSSLARVVTDAANSGRILGACVIELTETISSLLLRLLVILILILKLLALFGPQGTLYFQTRRLITHAGNPAWARGTPFPPLLLPCPFTSSSFALYYLFPFSFSHPLYLFSSIVHPIPFYQNSPTPFPGVRS